MIPKLPKPEPKKKQPKAKPKAAPKGGAEAWKTPGWKTKPCRFVLQGMECPNAECTFSHKLARQQLGQQKPGSNSYMPAEQPGPENLQTAWDPAQWPGTAIAEWEAPPGLQAWSAFSIHPASSSGPVCQTELNPF